MEWEKRRSGRRGDWEEGIGESNGRGQVGITVHMLSGENEPVQQRLNEGCLVHTARSSNGLCAQDMSPHAGATGKTKNELDSA